MPWFQVVQAIINLVLVSIGMYISAASMWPEIMARDSFSGGAVLFGLLVLIFVGSVANLIERSKEQKKYMELREQLVEARNAATVRDGMIEGRDKTIEILKGLLARPKRSDHG